MAHLIPTSACLQPVLTKAEVAATYECGGRFLSSLALAGIIALTSCGGPNQKAGSEQDKAAAAAQGEEYSGSGPNERIGEAKDRAAAAAQEVRDADADALKARGENLKRQADIDAARLDETSRSIREAAEKRATDLDEQAKAVRNPSAPTAKPQEKQ